MLGDRWPTAVVLASLAAFHLAACSSGDDKAKQAPPSEEARAKQSAQTFFTKLSDDDRSACELLVRPSTCDGGSIRDISVLAPEFPEAKRTKVKGEKAEVEVVGSGGATVVASMRKVRNAWKVDDFGQQK